ncbi:MAG TPA: type IV pilus secretin PilQ [Burkholderiales bacterium]|nr:type IV pilus secretin PilQ [Burkholderiales bacterium]
MSNVLVRRFIQASIGTFGLLLFASLAEAQQNSIENFDVTQSGGQVLVRVSFKSPIPAAPGSFTIANPARIAFDFPDTSNGLGRTSQDIGEGVLRSMNVVQAGERTRLVLNLRNMVSYESKIEGNNLLVTLAAATSGFARQAAGGGSARFAEGRSDVQHALRDINFRRGSGGEGRIVVELSDTSTGVDIRQQGQTVIVDFLKTSVPETLRKRYDVVDFATPVQTLSVFPQGDNVRMVIEPRGLWEHNAYQTDTQFVLEVKPIQYDPNKLVQGTRSGYTGEKLSLNFQNVEVRSVLNVIADFTDLNIITSDSVGGNLTLRLKDVPWDQALDIILQTRGLDMRKNGNVIWIAPRDELATKEKLALESTAQITELEPLRTETFQLNYAKADAFAKLLADPLQRILSKRGAASVDLRTNQVFVQDVGVRLEEVRKLLTQVDVPVQQVLIEARIVEANDSFSKNLGVRMGNVSLPLAQSGNSSGPSPIGGNVTGVAVTQTGTLADLPNLFPAGGGQITTKTPDNLSVNLPAAPVGNAAAAGSIALLITNKLTGALQLELSALEADGKGKIISSPRVMTANNVEALIEQGTELPYQQATSSGATSISFRKANLALKVRPQITPDGNVIMNLDINKDSVGQSTNAGFAIDTKHVLTQVLVENGGTVVIGGIYTQTLQTTITKVPFFGDLPLLGVLFRNNSRSDNKTELLVFITPRIVEQRLSQR